MKHKAIAFMRIIKTGGQYFIRNATLAIAAIAVMVITLTIILFSIISNATLTHTIEELTDKIDISVYLKDTVKEDEKDKIIQDLKNLENTKTVEYLDKNAVLENYKRQNANNIDLLLAISQTDNPLPATIKIKPKNPNRLVDIQAYLEKPEVEALQSDKTSYSGDTRVAVDKITASAQLLQKAGAVGVIIFATVSMLIIFNTIQMSIFNRRDELKIMRLLGAGTMYIRGPFVIETILYGVISAVVSIVLCNALFAVSSTAFSTSSLGLLDVTYANRYFGDNFWVLFTAQLLLGIMIGAASSTIATARYLKFKSSK